MHPHTQRKGSQVMESMPRSEIIVDKGCPPVKWTHAQLYYPSTGLLEERIHLQEATPLEVATMQRRSRR